MQKNDVCPACRGTTWVHVPEKNCVVRCECQERRIHEARVREILENWPEYKHADFRTYKPKTIAQQNALNVFRADPRGSYFLTGLYSRGKTHMLIAQYRWMSLAGDKCLLRSARELMEELRKYESQEPGKEFISPVLQMANLASSGHLFLDDIDKAPARSGFRVEALFDLFDTIKRRQLGLTVTSNLPLHSEDGKDLRSVLSDQVVSRLHRLCRVIEL
jgi:DNA replication protein DnaC